MPPSACDEEPLAVAARVGERAAHVAEQLALEQGRRHRGAVDGDERRLAARGCGGGWRARRAPCRCRVSPVMSTVASVSAMRSSSAYTAFIAGLVADELLEARWLLGRSAAAA